MDINISFDRLLALGLTLSEYGYLQILYSGEDNPDHYKVLDQVDEFTLQSRNFIKITGSEIVLRAKALELFEDKNLFLKFLNTFPIKTPSGRYLSPLRHSGMIVENVKKKWETLFGKKPHLQEEALAVLEAELNWRKRTGQMEYMHNIATWLHQADYEKFSYLLDDGQKGLSSDFM